MALFKSNQRLAEELSRQPEYREGLKRAAEPARQQADLMARAARAPWMRRRGARRVVDIYEDADEVGIVNTDHAGHLQEFGSRNNPPHAPLRRGARAAGLRLEETGRP